jgi:hypothetical protein
MNAAVAPQWTIDAMESGTIDPNAFDHEAHIHVAWLYLERYPLADAIGRFTKALQRLTRKLGVPDKYNETISWFYMLLIEERRGASPTDSWIEFRRINPDLFSRDENILERYYSRELVFSDRARQSFVLPNQLLN